MTATGKRMKKQINFCQYLFLETKILDEYEAKHCKNDSTIKPAWPAAPYCNILNVSIVQALLEVTILNLSHYLPGKSLDSPWEDTAVLHLTEN